MCCAFLQSDENWLLEQSHTDMHRENEALRRQLLEAQVQLQAQLESHRQDQQAQCMRQTQQHQHQLEPQACSDNVEGSDGVLGQITPSLQVRSEGALHDLLVD